MFVWITCIPAISYFTMGAKTGFYTTAVCYVIVGVQYFLRVQYSPEYLSTAALMNVIICTIGLWLYAHIYENFRVKSYAKLERLASRDPLTGLYNRLRMADIYHAEGDIAAKNGKNLGLIMVDLDHFKHVNDTYGHDVGDEVLCRVAKELQRSVRGDDYVFRMGGEEFCVMIVNVDHQQLVSIAEKLREKIAALSIEANEKLLPITASFGCTVAQSGEPSKDNTLDSLLRTADEFLYAAKNGGRNCVVAHSA